MKRNGHRSVALHGGAPSQLTTTPSFNTLFQPFQLSLLCSTMMYFSFSPNIVYDHSPQYVPFVAPVSFGAGFMKDASINHDTGVDATADATTIEAVRTAFEAMDIDDIDPMDIDEVFPAFLDNDNDDPMDIDEVFPPFLDYGPSVDFDDIEPMDEDDDDPMDIDEVFPAFLDNDNDDPMDIDEVFPAFLDSHAKPTPTVPTLTLSLEITRDCTRPPFSFGEVHYCLCRKCCPFVQGPGTSVPLVPLLVAPVLASPGCASVLTNRTCVPIPQTQTRPVLRSILKPSSFRTPPPNLSFAYFSRA